MKRRLRSAPLARAAAAVLLGALALVQAAGAQRIGIEGRVWADRDGDGADPGAQEPALAGVRVVLFRDGREIDAGVTDEAGRYRFTGLRTGAYKVAIDESTLPEELGLGPASFLERSYVHLTRSVAAADFGFVPHEVIERLAAATAEPGPAEPTATAEPGVPAPGPAPPPDARAIEEQPPGPAPALDEESEATDAAAGASTALWLLAILAALALLVLAVRRLAAGSRTRAGPVAAGPRETPAGEPHEMMALFLGYRDAQAWSEMDAVYRAMPQSMREMTVVRQQRAFALNRGGDHEAAERLLREQMAEDGASPESYGLMGRVFKDRMEAAHSSGDRARAAEMLGMAIDHYLNGHETDPSDPYPGINALTLMEWEASPRARRDALVAEVAQAVAARTASPGATYWDHATRLELSILEGDEAGAAAAVAAAVAAPKTPWQVETTLRNLRLLREAREARGVEVPGWAREAEERLAQGRA